MRGIRNKIWLIGFMVCVVIPGCSLFEPEFDPSPDPEEEIKQIVDQSAIPSVAACIVKGNQVVWEGAFGYANIEKKIPAEPSTIYGIASVSKEVVVTAVMQQVERGLLDLSQDISNYLPFELRNPKFPEDRITAQHLLTHTSGLTWPLSEDGIPNFYHYYQDDSAPPLAVWIPQYLLPNGDKYLENIWENTRPGEREYYSNIGTSVLALIVEEITDMNFRSYCREHIFLPLGMMETSYSYSDLELEKLAIPYGYSRAPLHFYSEMSFPGGNLKTSTSDFSKFLSAYINKGEFQGTRILKESSLPTIMKVHNPATGLCLLWNKTIGGWYGHAGGQEGVSAYAEFHPEHRLGIFIVSNLRNGYVYPGGRIHALVRQISRDFH